MKIGLICTEKLPVPAVAGGAIQLYIEGTLPYLSKVHDITLFSIEYPGLPAEEIKENVKYIRVPARSTKNYIDNIKKKLDASFDLIHVFNRPLWVLALSRVLPDTRISLSLHNEMFHPEKITDAEAVECVNRVEFINTVSKFIADGVKKRVPQAEGKLNVVYSGADIYKYKTNWTKEGLENKKVLKEKYGLKDYKVILYVGRLSSKKGAHILLKAMDKIMNIRSDVALIIIGSKWYGENEIDDYTNSLKAIAKNLKGPIVFTGFLPPSEVTAHYNLGDIFVCASQWKEPLARVHYEAMAAGLPIITTNRGGNAEVVAGQGNGIVINDYNNPDSFAAEISYLLDSPKTAAQMGEQGRRLAEEKYNWARVAGDIFRPVSAAALYTPDKKAQPEKTEEIVIKSDIPQAGKAFQVRNREVLNEMDESYFNFNF